MNPQDPADKPTACKQPPWQAILDRIDAAKVAELKREKDLRVPQRFMQDDLK